MKIVNEKFSDFTFENSSKQVSFSSILGCEKCGTSAHFENHANISENLELSENLE